MLTARHDHDPPRPSSMLSRLLAVMPLIVLERNRKASRDADEAAEEQGYEVPEPTVAFGIFGGVRPGAKPHEVTQEVLEDRELIDAAIDTAPAPEDEPPELYAEARASQRSRARTT